MYRRTSLLIMLLASLAAAQNVTVNGGLEAGSFSPWVANPSSLFPWAVLTDVPHSGTHYAYVGCSGANCISASPSAAGAWLYQDITTTPGVAYTLTFWSYTSAGQPSELQVLWGDSASTLTTGGAGACTGNCKFHVTPSGATAWTQYTVSNLVATSTSMRLEFLGRQDAGAQGLDDVVLTPGAAPVTSVPVMGPAAFLFLALMLAATGWWMFRRLGRSEA